MDQVTRDMVKLLHHVTKKIAELSDRVALLEYDKVKKAESDRKRAEGDGESSEEIYKLMSTVNAIGEMSVKASNADDGNRDDSQQTTTQEAPASISAGT